MANILVIEDDANMRTMVADVLTTAGHFVVQASGGTEALQLVKTAPPDLVITDILMPGQDGFEIIRSLQRDFPKLPVVAISGSSRNSPLYLKTAQQLGARQILHKPFSNEALLGAVNEALVGP